MWNIKKRNKRTSKTKFVETNNELVQRGRGWGEDEWVKGAKYVVLDGNQTVADWHAIMYTDTEL